MTTRRQVAQYMLSANAPAVVGLLSGVVSRRVLGPEAFGAFFLLASWGSYLAVCNAPLMTVIDVELPLMDRVSSRDDVHRIVGGTYGIFFAAVVAEAVALLVLGSAWAGGGVHGLLIVAAVAISLPLDGLAQIDRLLLKSNGEFSRLLRISGWTAIVEGMFDVALTLYFGLRGFAVAVVFGSLIRGAAYHAAVQSVVPVRVEFRRAWTHAGAHIRRAGGSVTLAKIVQLLTETIDRVFVGAFMGSRAVGVYSLAIVIVGMLKLVPRSIAGALLPSYLRSQATGEFADDTTDELHMTVTWITTGFGAALIVLAGFAIPVVFPAYAEAVRLAQLLIIAEVAQQSRFAQASRVLGSADRRPLLYSALTALVIATAGAAFATGQGSLTLVAAASIFAYGVGGAVLGRLTRDGTDRQTTLRTGGAMCAVGAVGAAAAWRLEVAVAVALPVLAVASTGVRRGLKTAAGPN